MSVLRQEVCLATALLAAAGVGQDDRSRGPLRVTAVLDTSPGRWELRAPGGPTVTFAQEVPARVKSMCLTADGHHLMVGSWLGTRIDPDTGDQQIINQPVAAVDLRRGTAEHLPIGGFTPDAQAAPLVASGTTGAEFFELRGTHVFLRDAQTGNVLQHVEATEAASTQRICASPGGQSIALVESDTLWLRDLRTGATAERPHGVLDLTWSTDGRRLATAWWNGNSWNSRSEIRVFDRAGEMVMSHALDNALAQAVDTDRDGALWFSDASAIYRAVDGQTEPFAQTLAAWFRLLADELIISHNRTELAVWSVRTGERLCAFRPGGEPKPDVGYLILEAVAAPSGRRVAVRTATAIYVYELERHS